MLNDLKNSFTLLFSQITVDCTKTEIHPSNQCQCKSLSIPAQFQSQATASILLLLLHRPIVMSGRPAVRPF